MRRMQMFLLHSSHLILICVTPASCSHPSLLINLSHCSLSLPPPAPHVALLHPLFFCLLLSCSSSPPVTLCLHLHPHLQPPLPPKERKVKGLKAQIQTETQKAEKTVQCM